MNLAKGYTFSQKMDCFMYNSAFPVKCLQVDQSPQGGATDKIDGAVFV